MFNVKKGFSAFLIALVVIGLVFAYAIGVAALVEKNLYVGLSCVFVPLTAVITWVVYMIISRNI